eukprot:4192840-Alexandrium_andersonii.AAC.1
MRAGACLAPITVAPIPDKQPGCVQNEHINERQSCAGGQAGGQEGVHVLTGKAGGRTTSATNKV